VVSNMGMCVAMLHPSTLKMWGAEEHHQRHRVRFDVSIQVCTKQQWAKEHKNLDLGTCSICLEETCASDTVGGLRCGHAFHQGCVETWLRRSPSCPVCRTNVAMPRFPHSYRESTLSGHSIV